MLGQDAYGAAGDLAIKGSVLPVAGPAAVGRLVETADEITGQIAQFLGLANQTLPTPQSSLVTGYDFLTSAADAVNGDLTAGPRGRGRATDQLITNQGVPDHDDHRAWRPEPHDVLDRERPLERAVLGSATTWCSWPATSARTTPSPPTTRRRWSRPTSPRTRGTFTNTLVFSAGCHSGYNIVDGDGVPGVTLGLDWAQEMAQQKADLHRRHRLPVRRHQLPRLQREALLDVRRTSCGPARWAPRSRSGKRWSRPSRTTSRRSPRVGGIDQKASHRVGDVRPADDRHRPARAPVPVTDTAPQRSPRPRRPRAHRERRSACAPRRHVDTPTTQHTSPVLGPERQRRPASRFSWLTGPDGTPSQPALPGLARAVRRRRPARGGQSLRGVGFRSGTYTDTPRRHAADRRADHRAERAAHDVLVAVVLPAEPRTASTTSTRSASSRLDRADHGRRHTGAVPVRLAGLDDRHRSARYSNVGLSLFYSSNIHARTARTCPRSPRRRRSRRSPAPSAATLVTDLRARHR